jgi:hypothetical protein
MTPTANLRRASLTGATLAVAAVLATGCNSSSSSSSAAAGATTPAATGASTPASAASSSAAATSGAQASPSPSGAAGQAGVAACTAASLKIATKASAGGGTAGSVYSFIDFTNTSSASCTLYGYPGVSLTAASGAQIGAAATRDATTAAAAITLPPGATANALLRMTDPTVYSTAKCQPATSAYLKVYPPSQTQSVKVSFKGGTCASSSVKMLSIRVITPGASPAGS